MPFCFSNIVMFYNTEGFSLCGILTIELYELESIKLDAV